MVTVFPCYYLVSNTQEFNLYGTIKSKTCRCIDYYFWYTNSISHSKNSSFWERQKLMAQTQQGTKSWDNHNKWHIKRTKKWKENHWTIAWLKLENNKNNNKECQINETVLLEFVVERWVCSLRVFMDRGFPYICLPIRFQLWDSKPDVVPLVFKSQQLTALYVSFFEKLVYYFLASGFLNSQHLVFSTTCTDWYFSSFFFDEMIGASLESEV